jgi:SAM-dependent methyltransferase
MMGRSICFGKPHVCAQSFLQEEAATIMDKDLLEYFRGEKLYGDDFNATEIEAWFRDEEDSYPDMIPSLQNFEYLYHALNHENGFRYLPEKEFEHILGFASVYGHELIPLLHKAKKVTIIEASERLFSHELNGVPITYVKAQSSGIVPFPDNSFDLIVCLGALHHIPNVSKVVNEFFRCLKQGGYALIHEPIKSMGDWTKPRKGLTKRERGIPYPIFRRIVVSTGFRILKESKTGHTATKLVQIPYERITKRSIYNSRTAMWFDKIFCSLFHIDRQYHPLKRHRGPTASGVFFVLTK